MNYLAKIRGYLHIRIAAEAMLCVAAALAVFTGLRTMLQSKDAAVLAVRLPEPHIMLPASELQAQAAVVYDPTTGAVLYDKNGTEQFPLASLTKIMAADAALDLLSATSTVPITPLAIATGGDYSGLEAGEAWQLGPLLKYTLLVSANDGMAAVAQSIGSSALLEQMNAEAQKLGLAQSYFLDPTGLDLTQGTSGAYGSARDVAALTADFYKQHPAYFESTADPRQDIGQSTTEMRLHATTLPILTMPGIIGAKTGYTNLAGGNLVVMFDVSLDHPLVAVVLHSSEQGRFSDMETLIAAAQKSAIHP